MNAAPAAIDWSTVDGLRAAGFEGFVPVHELIDSACLPVPVTTGVYIAVRAEHEPPRFRARGGGGWYRQSDPNAGTDELAAKWVEGAIVLYIGRACGPGVRSLLRQRVKRYVRFGQGAAIAHREGRHVWQLEDASRLKLAWREAGAEEASALEARLHAAFVERYGRLPFANLREEAGE